MNEENEDIAVTKICDRFDKSTVAYYKDRKARACLSNKEDFLFLSLMMDMFVCDIVGWAVCNSLKTEGPLAALAMASRTLSPDAKPVAHSDRGCQYNSHAYIEALGKLGWESSMTEELHCYENAMAERLNCILKHEYFLNTHFKTKAEAMKAIEEAIRVYNTRRLHESLGFKTPKAFREEAMRKVA